MNDMKLGGALALSLILAACGEKQNNGLENRQGSTADPAASQAGGVYSGTGEVTGIMGDKVTISHGPIEGIGWPAMTMTFGVPKPEAIAGLKAGDQVSFEFRKDGRGYALTSISRTS